MDQPDDRSRVRDHWYTIIWFAAAFFILAVFYGRYQPLEADKALVGSTAMIVIWFMYKAGNLAIKNATSQIVAPGFHASTTRRYYLAGNYLGYTMGGMRAWSIEWEGSEGTVFFPITSIEPMSEGGLVSTATPMPHNFDSLPLDCRLAIIEHNLPSPYYCAYATPTQYAKTIEETDAKNVDERKLKELPVPSISALVHETIERNKENSRLRKILEDKTEDIEKYVETSDRVRVRAKGGVTERLVSSLKRRRSDED